MTGLLVFVLIVAAIAAVGFALGMIVAGRIDRLMAPRSHEPSGTPSPPEEELP